MGDAARLPSDPLLTVNVSVDTLLSTDLAPILATSPRRLLIELTEHDLIHDYDSVRDAVDRLGGVGLCVDDAGSGYASLRHVLRLRPELVKLDRDWIAGLDQDPARPIPRQRAARLHREARRGAPRRGNRNRD